MKKYQMTKKQKLAHDAKEKHLMFGGAVGGGKSVWLVNECNLHCLKYPGARVYLCRHQLTSLRKTTLLTLEEWLPMEYIVQHHRTHHYFKYRNGSYLYYGGLGDDLKAIEKLKSMELSAYAIDQAEETTEDFFFMLNSRLRLKLKNIQYNAWLTANPTSNWVRTRFVESKLDDHLFIAALPGDNPYLPSSYIPDLIKVLPEPIAASWIFGNWDAITEENNLFSYSEIRAAMDRKADDSGSACIGADIARFGHDETVISMKRGNILTFEKILSKKDTMTTSGEIIRTARSDKSIPIKVDSIGVGGGVFDRIQEQGYNAREIIASARAEQHTMYKNKKAEDYFSFKNLLPKLQIPDDPKLLAQMLAIRYRVFSDGLLLIESKAELKRRGQTSPDRLESLIICCSGEGGEEIAPDPAWAGDGTSLEKQIEKKKAESIMEGKKGVPVDHPFLSAGQNRERKERGIILDPEVPGEAYDPDAEKRKDWNASWGVGSSGGQRKKKGDSRMAK